MSVSFTVPFWNGIGCTWNKTKNPLVDLFLQIVSIRSVMRWVFNVKFIRQWRNPDFILRKARIKCDYSVTEQMIWAATCQNQQSECAPSEESDQPGHPPSLIRVFTVRMKKAWVLSYALSGQWRLNLLVLSCRGSYLANVLLFYWIHYSMGETKTL